MTDSEGDGGSREIMKSVILERIIDDEAAPVHRDGERSRGASGSLAGGSVCQK